MNQPDSYHSIGLLGATSLAGQRLLNQLTVLKQPVIAFSRQSRLPQTNAVEWRKLDSTGSSDPVDDAAIPLWICLAPIWVIPDYFALLKNYSIKRIVVVSSTSRYTKDDSADLQEQAVAKRLADAEDRLQQWASEAGVEWVVLRPTLIYGLGTDKNISEIARFIQRFRFFPLFGNAIGQRQPIHVDDVARATWAALTATAAVNKSYNITGAETVSYREMVQRIFMALNRQPVILTVPLWFFSLAVACLRIFPRYRKWTSAMALRMNRDMVFDHSDARRDFAFNPRKFIIDPTDLPR